MIDILTVLKDAWELLEHKWVDRPVKIILFSCSLYLYFELLSANSRISTLEDGLQKESALWQVERTSLWTEVRNHSVDIMTARIKAEAVETVQKAYLQYLFSSIHNDLQPPKVMEAIPKILESVPERKLQEIPNVNEYRQQKMQQQQIYQPPPPVLKK